MQGQLRQLLVADQPVPFAGQRGDDLGGGRVQQALCRVGGLQYAMRIDVGERPLPAALGALVGVGARCGSRERVVRPVQYRDPLGPRVAPVAERLGVSGPGPQEIPPDMGPAPERVDAVDAGQRLIGLVEIGGDDQAAPGLQL
jgi:hypothetical protein